MVPDDSGDEPDPKRDGVPDDLGIASDIEALVAAVETDGGSAGFDDDLMGDAELAKLAEIADDAAAGESGAYAELDEEDFEELDSQQVVEGLGDLEDETGPRTLYLDIDGTTVEVDKERFVIGRASKMCDFAIVDVNISRQHCAIERRDDGYYVVDYGSINGVEIDGKRVDDHRIAEGDELVLAGHRISASFEAPTPVPPAVDEAPDATIEEPAPPAVASEVETRQTGQLEPVPVESTPPTGTYIPAPPHDEPPVPAQPRPYEPAAADTFEQRVEQRLDVLSRQLAYLQQSVDALMARVDQLQDVAGLASMIRRRLATDPKRR